MTDRLLNPAMAWDRLLPPERGGEVTTRTPLTVAPLRRLDVLELLIVDDDLPQADGATCFWLDRLGDRWRAWAARIEGQEATPWLVTAPSLHLEQPDPALVALVALAGPLEPQVAGDARPLEPMPRALACICRETTAGTVYRSIEAGWATVEEVKRRTGAAFGECQGRRCVPVIAQRLEQAAGERGAAITPRPPLVPVPASVLAAFAGL
jgi:bacterioferritin-associated ferredoxin